MPSLIVDDPALLEDIHNMNQEYGVSPKVAARMDRERGSQMAKTSETIGRNLRAMQSGAAPSGDYPALERVFKHRPRRRLRAGPTSATPQPPQRLITDVTPTVRERVAVVEHIAGDLKEKFKDHIDSSQARAEKYAATYVTRPEMKLLEGRVTSLETKSAWRTVGVVISVLGSVGVLLWYAIQFGSKLAHQL